MIPSGLNSDQDAEGQKQASEAARSLVAATAQIGLALQEAQQPVAELGMLIGHISDTLQALRDVPLQRAGDPVTAESARGLLEQLQSDVFRGVRELQFYDRMVQHLEHVQDYLLRVADQLAGAPVPQAEGGPWLQLHERLRRRLISDSQRAMLDLFLGGAPDGSPARVARQAELSPPGSLELF